MIKMKGHNFDHGKGDICKKCGKIHKAYDRHGENNPMYSKKRPDMSFWLKSHPEHQKQVARLGAIARNSKYKNAFVVWAENHPELAKLQRSRAGKRAQELHPHIIKNLNENVIPKLIKEGVFSKLVSEGMKRKDAGTKISLIKKKLYEEHPEKHPNRILAQRKGISKPQLKMYEWLKSMYSDAELNYPIRTKNGYRYADVAVPSLKTDFEYDDPYWHKEKDLKRSQEITEAGWNIFHFGPEELEHNLREFKRQTERIEDLTKFTVSEE